MDIAQREVIRSNLYQVDLLLRQVERKTRAVVEIMGSVQGSIKAIEGHKKAIYAMLEGKGGAIPPLPH